MSRAATGQCQERLPCPPGSSRSWRCRRRLSLMGEGHGVIEAWGSGISRHLEGKRGGDPTPGTCLGFPRAPTSPLPTPEVRQVLRGPQHSPRTTVQPLTSWLLCAASRRESFTCVRASAYTFLRPPPRPRFLIPSCLLPASPPSRLPTPRLAELLNSPVEIHPAGPSLLPLPTPPLHLCPPAPTSTFLYHLLRAPSGLSTPIGSRPPPTRPRQPESELPAARGCASSAFPAPGTGPRAGLIHPVFDEEMMERATAKQVEPRGSSDLCKGFEDSATRKPVLNPQPSGWERFWKLEGDITLAFDSGNQSHPAGGPEDPLTSFICSASDSTTRGVCGH
ncbi:uncharacterized protein LOC128314918 [Acinonyx jubatus]|uniref:Uncharacterized protein LOC128314918 n=1 Tax=Acinonyx jubatus TaxID=32536 RepID=A0ABM3PVC4_ACIJB|nr:uncharacterized protein LOC128314918 [Acinonyx jubatus]